MNVSGHPYLHRGGSWSSDDRIVFSQESGPLLQVADSGGTAEPITSLDTAGGDLGHLHPDVLPGGRAVLFSVLSSGAPRIVVESLDTGHQSPLGEGSWPRYVRTGHVVFGRDDAIWAVPFDLDRLNVSGTPQRVLDGVADSQFTISEEGTLAYASRGGSPPRSLMWVRRDGSEERVGADWPQPLPPGQYLYPRISPDGARLALVFANSVTSMNTDGAVWALDLVRGSRTLVVDGGNSRWWPVWRPDGTHLVVITSALTADNRVLLAAANGVGPRVSLFDRDDIGSGVAWYPSTWSGNARALAGHTRHDSASVGRSIAVVPIGADGTLGTIRTFTGAYPLAEERGATFSPNGQWLAYVSDESGQDEVYVQAYPGAGQRVTVSTDGGVEPVWSRDGSELFYRREDQLWAVAAEADSFSAVPQLLFQRRYDLDSSGPGGVSNYDVAEDGRFVMVKTSGTPEINVVFNWAEQLRQIAPTN